MTHGISIDDVEPRDVNIGVEYAGMSICVPQTIHRDYRGYLVVDLQDKHTSQECLQVYHSMTLPGEARDADQWHLHKEQMDRFFIISGTAQFALSDGRSVQRFILSADDPYMLMIPPGVYHCLRCWGDDPIILLNVPNRVYNPEDEIRVLFSDLEAPRPW